MAEREVRQESESESDFFSPCLLLFISGCAYIFLQFTPDAQKDPQSIPALENTASAETPSANPWRVDAYTRAQSSVNQLGGQIGLEGALGDVKNQNREGACTAFALSSAVEALLYARFQIRARVNELRFWKSYATPRLAFAFAAAASSETNLVAVVAEASRYHPFAEGTRLRIQIPLGGVERLSLADVPETMNNRFPVLLSTVYQDFWMESHRSSAFIPAHQSDDETGHVTLLRAMRTDLNGNGDLWLQLRNSWGEGWGEDGNALLDAKHCLLNACEFTAIKELKIFKMEAEGERSGESET